jgi:nitroreductase
MDVREALYTTRAMRRVRPDPVPSEVQMRILDAAIRAPSGGNTQNWRFLLVDDPAIRAQIGALYRDSMDQLWKTFYAPRIAAAVADPDDPVSVQTLRMQRSAQHLADHFDDVPLLLFGFAQGDASGGSIFPAIWSAQLAARAEGVGSALTSVLGAFHRNETMAVLGAPTDGSWTMACCVTFGYPLGRWGVAPRAPAHDVTFHNQWGSPPAFTVPQPLWPGP